MNETLLTMEYLVYGLYGLAALSLLLAVYALVAASRARRRLRELEGSLSALEQSMQSAAGIFAETDIRMNAACEQINQLARRQGSLDAASGQSGFKQAIALSKRGASETELVDTCGVTEGEARLILTMYGVGGTASQFS